MWDNTAMTVSENAGVSNGGNLVRYDMTDTYSTEGIALLDAIGVDIIIEQFGLVPTVVGTIVLVGLLVAVFFGGRAWVTRAREASRNQIAGNLRAEIEDGEDTDSMMETVDGAEDDVLSEATSRLEREGRDLNGENLRDVLSDIEEEAKQLEDGAAPTGLLDEPGDKKPVAKMSVAPEDIEPHEDYIKVRSSETDDYFARTMMIAPYPNRVSYGWLDKLFSGGLETTGADVRTTYHIWPRDTGTMMDELNKQATRLTSRIRKKEQEGKIDTIDEEQRREKINDLRDRLSKGETQIYDFALYVQVKAEDKEALNDGTKEVKNMFSQANARVVSIVDQQVRAFQSGAPLGQDLVRQTQIMDMESLATTFPFIEPTRAEPSGVLLGFHYTTNSPVIVDRFKLSGHNCLITGKIGGGKSYLAKLMMWRRLMMDPDTELMIIDPVGGFGDMVEALGGQIITIDKDTIINPLEIREERHEADSMDEDPYDVKIRTVMGMFRQHFGSLEKGEEGVLRRSIKYAYLKKGITKNPRTHSRESPTIQDVMDILRQWSHGKRPREFLDVDEQLLEFVGSSPSQEDDDGELLGSAEQTQKRESQYAQDVLLGMEEFKPGGQRDNLNGETNIDLDARVVQFDLENVVDANNAGLIMHIMLDYLFQRAKSTINRSLVTIDEAHYMLGDDGATSVLNTFVRHSRHYESGVTLISQTVDEFMDGDAKEIYDQCDIRLLMRHEDISDGAVDALGIDPPERSFVLGAQAGNTADHSECLLLTSDSGSRRMRVYSNDFEHHVVDEDAVNVWTMLYQNDMVSWDSIPPQKQQIVRSELNNIDHNAPA